MDIKQERVRLQSPGREAPLSYERLTDPPEAPTDDQVLVRVEACGVCHRDLIDRAGRFPFMQFPITPGHEAAGRVIAVGPAVQRWRIGDRVGTLHRDACGSCDRCHAGEPSLCGTASWVLGILADGGYASHLRIPESGLYALPETIEPAEAATLHCTFGTAYRDLRTLGRLQAGERVLITGANGGVGSAAVQIARRLGAEVLAVVRQAHQRPYLLELGAHSVIVDDGTGFHECPEAGAIDLALEAVGYSTFRSTLRCLRSGGRMVVVGNIVPEKVQLNLGYLITHGLSVIGGSGATPGEMAEVLALHQAQPFIIQIDRTLPLSRAEEAQQLVRAGNLRGRIVLVPDQHVPLVHS